MPDRYFDLIYIDAGHSYADVKKDCKAATKKVKEDGILVFNDYVLWSPWEGWAYGVVQAVNELICDGWDVVGFALASDGYHDIAVQKRPRDAEHKQGQADASDRPEPVAAEGLPAEADGRELRKRRKKSKFDKRIGKATASEVENKIPNRSDPRQQGGRARLPGA